MTVVLCQHCGADLSHHPSRNVEAPSTSQCFDCGLASADGGAWQPSFHPQEEIRYRLHDWSSGRRLALGLALHDAPFRWEPGPIIVVREEGRSVVDAFLEASGTGSDGAGDDTDVDHEDDEDDEDDGVESAMGDLFVCADQLVRAPWKSTAVRRLRELGALVRSSIPPFGIPPGIWKELATRASAIAAASDEGDHDSVEDRARHLRLFLRDYV
ncbi:MAG TPA: hypothetical protein VGV93_13010 [Acidimicrobiales bacterium]|nr:hypothetical protein [Acidimicrobiales bacterium]